MDGGRIEKVRSAASRGWDEHLAARRTPRAGVPTNTRARRGVRERARPTVTPPAVRTRGRMRAACQGGQSPHREGKAW